ncbi:MAG: carboxymuconolactone decarboxylase family protein [Planctomycetes bacterium]|nr:carboxymuconolactone decarboxylase family protein [Planctomycetota bacterium]
MPRIPYPSLKRTDNYTVEVIEELKEKLGYVPHFHLAVGNSPGVLGAVVALEKALRRGTLSSRYRELAALAVARVLGCRYATVHHAALAREAGADERQVDEIPRFEESDSFDAREKSVLRYATELARNARPEDRTFLGVAAFLSPGELVELTAAIGYVLLEARVCETFGIEIEDAMKEA